MIDRLIEIASALEFSDLLSSLTAIKLSQNGGNSNIIAPLIGEFSSGKTTLINALSDSKKLECAIKPTTATIYDIHFGNSENHATIHYEDGTIEEVNDISSLKNEKLLNATIVDVFDTSNKIPESIIIVDTPGLSSAEPKHKQNLINFLPKADAILLVVDINQQITRSLTDFAKAISVSHRPLYLIFSQCDTKTKSEVQAAKEYFKKNSDLPIVDIACISAKNGDMDEFYKLLKSIQQDKDNILAKVNDFRCKHIATEMTERIDVLLKSSKNDNSIDDAIREQKLKLSKIKHQINSIVDGISSDIDNIGREISHNFEDTISSKLEAIVSGKSNNFDSEAVSAINTTAGLMITEYKTRIASTIKNKADEALLHDSSVSLRGLMELDLSRYAVGNLSYNLSLNELGHQYDSAISTVAKVASVAGIAVSAVSAIGSVGSSIAKSVTNGAKEVAASAATVSTISSLADTASDIGSIISNNRTKRQMQEILSRGQQYADQLTAVNNINNQVGAATGANKGIIESMVGFVTDKTMGKPQRKRAIHEYIDSSLLPEFNLALNSASFNLQNDIRNALTAEASSSTQEITNALENLKSTKNEQESQRVSQINKLKELKKELLNLQ